MVETPLVLLSVRPRLTEAVDTATAFAGVDYRVETSIDAAELALAHGGVHLVLIDALPEDDIRPFEDLSDAVSRLRSVDPRVTIVVIGAPPELDAATAGVAGADHYLELPCPARAVMDLVDELIDDEIAAVPRSLELPGHDFDETTGRGVVTQEMDESTFNRLGALFSSEASAGADVSAEPSEPAQRSDIAQRVERLRQRQRGRQRDVDDAVREVTVRIAAEEIDLAMKSMSGEGPAPSSEAEASPSLSDGVAEPMTAEGAPVDDVSSALEDALTGLHQAPDSSLGDVPLVAASSGSMEADDDDVAAAVEDMHRGRGHTIDDELLEAAVDEAELNVQRMALRARRRRESLADQAPVDTPPPGPAARSSYDTDASLEDDGDVFASSSSAAPELSDEDTGFSDERTPTETLDMYGEQAGGSLAVSQAHPRGKADDEKTPPSGSIPVAAPIPEGVSDESLDVTTPDRRAHAAAADALNADAAPPTDRSGAAAEDEAQRASLARAEEDRAKREALEREAQDRLRELEEQREHERRERERLEAEREKLLEEKKRVESASDTKLRIAMEQAEVQRQALDRARAELESKLAQQAQVTVQFEEALTREREEAERRLAEAISKERTQAEAEKSDLERRVRVEVEAEVRAEAEERIREVEARAAERTEAALAEAEGRVRAELDAREEADAAARAELEARVRAEAEQEQQTLRKELEAAIVDAEVRARDATGREAETKLRAELEKHRSLDEQARSDLEATLRAEAEALAEKRAKEAAEAAAQKAADALEAARAEAEAKVVAELQARDAADARAREELAEAIRREEAAKSAALVAAEVEQAKRETRAELETRVKAQLARAKAESEAERRAAIEAIREKAREAEARARREADEQARAELGVEVAAAEQRARADAEAEVRRQLEEERERVEARMVDLEQRLKHEAAEQLSLELARQEDEHRRLSELIEKEIRAETEERAKEALRVHVEKLEVRARQEAEEHARTEVEAALQRREEQEARMRARLAFVSGRFDAIEGYEAPRTHPTDVGATEWFEGQERHVPYGGAPFPEANDEPFEPPPPPPMRPMEPEAGEFDDGEIAAVLFSACFLQVTGRLDVVAPDGRRRSIYLELGEPVAVTSTLAADRPEEALLRAGLITSAQHAELRAGEAMSARRLCARLIGDGVLKTNELFGAVRGALTEQLLGVLEWDAGAFVYEEDRAHPADRVRLVHGFEAILADGIRRKFDEDRLWRVLGGPATILGPDRRAPRLPPLGPAEKAAAALFDGTRSLEDVTLEVMAPHELILRTAMILLASGAAVIVARGLPRGPADRSEERERAVTIDSDRIRDRLRIAREGDYFELLGVPETATPYEVQRAADQLRQRFDPARFTDPAFADLKQSILEIREVVDDAAQVLSDEQLRDAYRTHRRRPAHRLRDRAAS